MPDNNDSAVVLLNIKGSENTSQEFKDKVVQIASRLKTNPNFLMAVMAFESAGTFRSDIKNPASNATGLIQFMPKTAKGLGTTLDKLAALTPVEQLDFVEAHFKPFTGKLATIEDVYMTVLFPAAVGKGSEFVLFRKGTIAFQQNSGLDVDQDGLITVADATTKVKLILHAAQAGTGVELRRGATGPEVEKLQDELVELGHLRLEDKAAGPGKFGPRTEIAVKEFQRDNNLAPNGIYGLETRAAMQQIHTGVKHGDTGNVVHGLQKRLIKLGNITESQVATGPKKFGPKTETALKQFQQQHGLEQTGVLLPVTYKALHRAAPLPPPPNGNNATAIDTVLPESGPGFRTYSREAGGADQFARAATINNLLQLAAAWDTENPGLKISIGNLSRRGGGPFPGHKSHKDGRDADLRPLRHSGEPGPTNIKDPSYDHALTRKLVLLIRRLFPGVKIFFNDPILVAAKLTQLVPSHNDHLHVRFR